MNRSSASARASRARHARRCSPAAEQSPAVCERSASKRCSQPRWGRAGASSRCGLTEAIVEFAIFARVFDASGPLTCRRLDVRPEEVGPELVEASCGCSSAKGAVFALVVISPEEAVKRSGALCAVTVDRGIGPLREHRANEALRLAVGLR